MSFTEAQLQSIVPTLHGDKLKATCDSLNAAMELGGLIDPKVQAMFVAQTAHESGGYFYVKELASGAAYEGRKDLGNIHPGDGVKYKGRTWIQITGLGNYQKLSDFYKVDFVAHPELLETSEWAAKGSVWFWNTHHLSDIAIAGTDEAFVTVTHRINGGENGLDSRRAYWAKAKIALGI